jgi:hypothetical protein
VHALQLRVPTAEIPHPIESDRPDPSALRTYSDGIRILGTIATLVKEEP